MAYRALCVKGCGCRDTPIPGSDFRPAARPSEAFGPVTTRDPQPSASQTRDVSPVQRNRAAVGWRNWTGRRYPGGICQPGVPPAVPRQLDVVVTYLAANVRRSL